MLDELYVSGNYCKEERLFRLYQVCNTNKPYTYNKVSNVSEINMIIHVVREGETIDMIADQYGVSPERLILENEIVNPYRLVVGEAIVVLIPEITYTIQEGDTLSSIADSFGVDVLQLLRNNPYLSDREYIYPGETIVISYEGEKIRSITTNSYAYPFINMATLRKNLLFLTSLTILSYKVTAEGEIIDIDDREIIQVTKEYRVAPIMMLEAFALNMEEEISVIHSILSSQEKQDLLINNLLTILQAKGYSGVNINTPYINPIDRTLYEDFIIKLYVTVSSAGYKVYNTFTIRVFQLLTGTIFAGLDYASLGQHADGIILITYDFGFSEGIPPGTSSLSTYRRFFEYATRVIPPDKTFVGISVIGFLWQFPYIPGITRGMAVSYNAAREIAIDTNSAIEFDETTNSAYFQYISDENEYVVRFWDARSINNLVGFVPEFGLQGISIWNIMSWFPQQWLVINSQYNIDKAL